MKLPDVIKLVVTADSPTDLSGLVFSLVVSSGRKNKYSIHFPKTSEEGTAELFGKRLQGSIRRSLGIGINGEIITLEYEMSAQVDRDGNEFKYRFKVKDTNKAKVARLAWDVFFQSVGL